MPGSERSPGGGNGNPFHYFCLKNLVGRGGWWVPWGPKESEWATEHAPTCDVSLLLISYIYIYIFFISDVVFLISSNLTWFFLQFTFLFCNLLEHIKYTFNSCFNVLSTDYAISASASWFSSYWYWDNMFYCLIVCLVIHDQTPVLSIMCYWMFEYFKISLNMFGFQF